MRNTEVAVVIHALLRPTTRNSGAFRGALHTPQRIFGGKYFDAGKRRPGKNLLHWFVERDQANIGYAIAAG